MRLCCLIIVWVAYGCGLYLRKGIFMSKKCCGGKCSGKCSKPKGAKRGRPRKEDSAVAVAPKRGRGRPRKEEEPMVMVEEIILNEGVPKKVTRDEIRAVASMFRQYKKFCEGLGGEIKEAFDVYKDGKFAKRISKVHNSMVKALGEFNNAIRETGVR